MQAPPPDTAQFGWIIVTAFVGLLSAIASGLVILFVTRSARERDRRLENIDGSIKDLTVKVGAQNGRVSKLEQWSTDHDSWSKRTEDRLTRAVATAKKVLTPRKRRQ